jgi:hypothetical protein
VFILRGHLGNVSQHFMRHVTLADSTMIRGPHRGASPGALKSPTIEVALASGERSCSVASPAALGSVLFLFIPDESMGYLVNVCCAAGPQGERHFRTINVQWIGQWGLFRRCGISQNQ